MLGLHYLSVWPRLQCKRTGTFQLLLGRVEVPGLSPGAGTSCRSETRHARAAGHHHSRTSAAGCSIGLHCWVAWASKRLWRACSAPRTLCFWAMPTGAEWRSPVLPGSHSSGAQALVLVCKATGHLHGAALLADTGRSRAASFKGNLASYSGDPIFCLLFSFLSPLQIHPHSLPVLPVWPPPVVNVFPVHGTN